MDSLSSPVTRVLAPKVPVALLLQEVLIVRTQEDLRALFRLKASRKRKRRLYTPPILIITPLIMTLIVDK